MEALVTIAIIIGLYYILKVNKSATTLKEDSNESINVNNVDPQSAQGRAKSIQKIIDESCLLMYNSKNLDVVLSRYATCKFYLLELQNPDFTIDNLDEVMNKVQDDAIHGVGWALQIGWNERLNKIQNMKTANGKANNAIKGIKYFEEEIPKIPSELADGAKEWIDQTKGLIVEMTAKDGEYTQMLREADIDIPDWWKRHWTDMIE
jgi:hypothetical protein